MGYRSLPYTEAEGKPQFAGMGSGGGSGGSYSLPTATASRLGGVKIGSGVSVADDGTISVGTSGYQFAKNTKVDTGLKWIDGRTVYAIVLDGAYNTNQTRIASVSSYNIDIIVNISNHLERSWTKDGIITGKYNIGGNNGVMSHIIMDYGTTIPDDAVATVVLYYVEKAQ